jgi:hypothetical protein
MQPRDIYFLLSLSIVFTILIGVIRYKKIDPPYYPFFYYAAITLFVEVFIYIFLTQSNKEVAAAIANFSSIIEFSLLTWLFHNWGLFNFNRNIFLLILGIYFLCWLVLVFFVSHVTVYNKFFPVIYALTLGLFAVNTFNRFVIQDRKALFKNPKFWISLGAIIAFVFFLLKSAASLTLFISAENVSTTFVRKLQNIVAYSNLLVNLMYATGALWMKKKKNFTGIY